jgi:flagellar motor switch protein FliN/FliY
VNANEISPEVLTNFIIMQAKLWPAVVDNLSEKHNSEITIPTPTVEAVPLNELVSFTSRAVLHAQFTFAEYPDDIHFLCLSGRNVPERDNWQNLAEAMLGTTPDVPDEKVLSTLGSYFGNMVEGLGTSLTTLRETPFTPDKLTMQYAPFTLPTDFLNLGEIVEVRLETIISEREMPVEFSWYLSEKAARKLTGLPEPSSEDPLETLVEMPEQGEEPAAQTSPAPFTVMEGKEEAERGLDLLLDIPLEVSVELGRIEMLIRDVLELGSGSIIELKKAAGEPADVMVNGKLVARGEVVVVEDNFGVRITEVISPADRIQRLGA